MPSDGRTTVLAAFDDRMQAVQAVRDLEHAAFRSDDIGFVLRGHDAVRGGMITDAVGAKDGRGAVAGALSGGAIGGVLAAAASLLIPGIGPVMAGGLLTMAVGGAIAGTAIGGIYGALQGLELSEAEAKFYDQEFRAGKAIVAVRAKTRMGEALDILRRHGGYCFTEDRSRSVRTEGFMSEP